MENTRKNNKNNNLRLPLPAQARDTAYSWTADYTWAKTTNSKTAAWYLDVSYKTQEIVASLWSSCKKITSVSMENILKKPPKNEVKFEELLNIWSSFSTENKILGV